LIKSAATIYFATVPKRNPILVARSALLMHILMFSTRSRSPIKPINKTAVAEFIEEPWVEKTLRCEAGGKTAAFGDFF
jgi:hypothetical protein